MTSVLRNGAVWAATLLLAAAVGAAPPVGKTAAPRPPVDPVAELQGQDSAFSLLIECYRQLQLSLIEIEYEHRLDEADQIADATARNLARAETERNAEERVRRLASDLENMLAAYQTSRATHEREAGLRVPHQIDRYKAARSLRKYVAFEPPEKGGVRNKVTGPAATAPARP